MTWSVCCCCARARSPRHRSPPRRISPAMPASWCAEEDTMMTRTTASFLPLALASLLLLALAGCAQTDPYTRPGAWRPNGANDANLRAMVVVPSDLVLARPAAHGYG